MPIIRVKIRIGPETLKNLERYYANQMEPWPDAVPKEIEVTALIDTGASVSIIDSSIVEKLALRSYGYCRVSGFDSPAGNSGKAKRYPNYEVGFSLLDESGEASVLTVGTGQLVGQALTSPRFDAMIGMDVLKHCHFNLDGPNDSFELTAPIPHVDEISSVTFNGD